MTHTLPYNDRAIRAAAALDNKRTRYTITGKTGLMLVVLPGDPEPSRTYYVRYQVGKGASRRQGYDPIGSAKHFSCAQAWDRASEIIRAEIGRASCRERV